MTQSPIEEEKNKCEQCGTTENVSFEPDPYAQELVGDDTKVWLCDEVKVKVLRNNQGEVI